MITCSVIIVNWNTKELLRQCLKSVLASTDLASVEIWVVDNASDDGSAGMVEKEFPAVRLVCNQVNVGFSAANNQAIRMASSKYVLLLNPDTRIVGDAIGAMVAFLEGNGRVGAVGCKLLNGDGSTQLSCHSFNKYFKTFTYAAGLHSLIRYNSFSKWVGRFFGNHLRSLVNVGNYDTAMFPDWVLGACLLVRREAFDHIGLLDERLFMYADDEDLCYRLNLGGWKVAYIPDGKVIHYGGQSSKQAARTMAVESWRSRLFFFERHYGRRSVTPLKIVILAGMGLRLLSCLPLAALGRQGQRSNVSTCFRILASVLRFRGSTRSDSCNPET